MVSLRRTLALRQMMRSPMFCVYCSVLLHGQLDR